MLRTKSGLNEAQAREALLNEYHPSMPGISSGSPARTVRHPFTKVLGASPGGIYARWSDPSNKASLTQSWPDFALRASCPHKIAFEGKYFSKGSLHYAQRELVTNIYQAFFTEDSRLLRRSIVAARVGITTTPASWHLILPSREL
jgi:hypothetical protein